MQLWCSRATHTLLATVHVLGAAHLQPVEPIADCDCCITAGISGGATLTQEVPAGPGTLQHLHATTQAQQQQGS